MRGKGRGFAVLFLQANASTVAELTNWYNLHFSTSMCYLTSQLQQTRPIFLLAKLIYYSRLANSRLIVSSLYCLYSFLLFASITPVLCLLCFALSLLYRDNLYCGIGITNNIHNNNYNLITPTFWSSARKLSDMPHSKNSKG